ncbi:hypothetical protein B0T26DRAFT_737163 [Lasiosphaeria miniovina]|uniref:DUF1996 domain-containing protein n=1 Tax=Lasiosphaeria miniovina TaxID=1954250 RepID=A0AA40BHT8_9PEZI|nr:uncharacterized protein B0T26DRAFT_737163 [Lasiosphaeria miniovina]KAK0734507.1 hypothetical protein B0T26DRAFT_737163 [Lasiosphaeria miniovina]
MLCRILAAVALLRVFQDGAAQNVNVGRLLRFSCNQLVIERIDPLVTPGMSPSTHTHQIVGGNSFNATMDPDKMDPAFASTCTSCTYAEDFSNYWTASLYFRSAENGSYRMVPQQPNFIGLDGVRHPQSGGFSVYYMAPFHSANQKVVAFKPGFRMLSGDPAARSEEAKFAGICHRCNGNGEGFIPCLAPDASGFPARICPKGIRASVKFPSCWDGKNLDSPDHRSHVAYWSGSGVLAGAECPASHPVRIPQLMYEINWDTAAFNDPRYFEGGRQPFVYSFGDATGHGQHGDCLFGWQGDALQRGMDALLGDDCLNDACATLKSQSAQDVVKCTKKTQVPEDVGIGGEWLDALLGNVPIM